MGSVLSVEGKPVLTVKQTSSRLDLRPGLKVSAGDAIDTDHASKAKVYLIDETILDIHSDARVLIPRLIAPDSPQRRVLIEVERGKVRAKVNREVDRNKGRFEIHTYAATLGVEGTDFVVDVQPPDASGLTKTTIIVVEGQVAVRAAKDGDNANAAFITLPAGTRYTAVAKIIGETLEQDALNGDDIEKLKSSEWNELARLSRLDNESFVQAISLAGGAGFGASTLAAVSAGVRADRIPAVRAASREEQLFRKRFRDDDLNSRSNLVKLTVGFPQ